MFIYRFLNYEDEVIYIGITDNIFRRIEQQHFTNTGHLPLECYTSTKMVEHMEYGDLSFFEAEIIECLLIEKYKPIYNNGYNQNIGDIRNSKFITLNEEYLIENWKIYKEMNVEEIIKNTYKKKLKAEGKGDLLKITKDEINRLLEIIEQKKDYRTKAIVNTLLLTDMQLNDCLNITINDLDIDFVIGKNNKQFIINKVLKDIWIEYLKVRKNTSDKLFTGQRGSLTPSAVHRILLKYSELANIKKEKCNALNIRNITWFYS